MGHTKHPCVLATEVKGSHSPKASAKKPRDFMRDRARRPTAVGSWHAPKKFVFSCKTPDPTLSCIFLFPEDSSVIPRLQELGIWWVRITNGSRERWWQ